MELTSVVDITRIFAGVGAITIALTYFRRRWERYRWDCYKRYVFEWLSDSRESEKHLNNEPESWWIVECQERLILAGFSPLELKDLGELPIVIAKARAHDMFLLSDDDSGTPHDDQ